VSVLYLLLGLLGLLLGADMAVGGSLRLARRWNWPGWVAGMLLLALGTSLPELFIAFASAPAYPNLALGTVFGSNAVNVGGVLGLLLIFQNRRGLPLRETGRTPLAILVVGSGLAFWAFSQTTPNQVASFSLLFLFIVLLVMTLWKGAKSSDEDPVSAAPGGLAVSLSLALGGFALLAGASELFLHGALGIAENLGWGEGVTGYIIAALGTSAPEFFTSMKAIRKGQPGAVFGNIVGSNAFNLLLVGGAIGFLADAPFLPDALQIQLVINLVATLALIALILPPRGDQGRRTKLGIIMGFVLLAAYLYSAWIVGMA
jgi:cation:H+ antiporter